MRISDWISDVFSSDLGVLPLPTATLATNADPAVRAAWLEAMFLPPAAFDWPLNVLVVRSGDQTILVDPGLGGEFPGFPRAGQFLPRLAAAGIDLAGSDEPTSDLQSLMRTSFAGFCL